MSQALVRRCSVKKVPIEVAQNSHENTCVRVSFSEPPPCNFIKKEALAQVFPCEFGEISKNTFYYKTTLVVASGIPTIYDFAIIYS